jgi:hypothetical protein
VGHNVQLCAGHDHSVIVIEGVSSAMMSRSSPDTAHRLALGEQHDFAHAIKTAAGIVVKCLDGIMPAVSIDLIENEALGAVFLDLKPAPGELDGPD